MVKSNFFKVNFVFCTILLMGSHASAQSKSPLKKYDFSPLERKIQGWIDSGYYPRASILIARNNQIIYRNYCGNYKPETVAYIAFESN